MKKWMLLLSLVLMIVIVNCGQAQAAEETATKDITFEELNEILGIAVYMGGGPSLMYAANAVAAFKEFSPSTAE